MKRIVSLILIACMVLCFAGCSNPKNAKWEGYDEMPFIEFLEKGLEAAAEDEDVDCEITVTVEDGWDESEKLDEDDLSDGAKAVTYIVTIDFGTESELQYFFMELDKELKVRGGQEREWGELDGYELTAKSAEEMLEELVDYVD